MARPGRVTRDGPCLMGENWYSQTGLRFRCLPGCSACCGSGDGFVAMTPQEFGAICEFLSTTADELAGTKIEPCNSHFVVKMTPQGRCPFAEVSGCAIYSVRPTQCWAWPWWNSNLESPDTWCRAARRCPGIGVGRVWELAEIRMHADAQARSTPFR